MRANVFRCPPNNGHRQDTVGAIFRLERANPTYASALQRLRAAAASGKPLRVRFLAPNSDIIETVRSDE